MKTVSRLLLFLRPLSGWVILSMLLSMGTIASNIGLLGTSAYLIASAALHPSVAELQVAIVGVEFFGIARGVLRYAERLYQPFRQFSAVGRTAHLVLSAPGTAGSGAPGQQPQRRPAGQGCRRYRSS